MTWKIGLGVLIISVLAWLPQGVTPALTWWGPAPCWAGDGPEVIVTHSVIKDNSLTGINPHSNAIISHSFAGFKGISQVNQASGFMSNQMNVVSISNSPGQLNPEHQRSWVADNNNTLTGENHRNCSITGGSYKHAAGIVEVNQSAGSMNTQLNAVALTIGKKGCTSLSDGDLDGFCTPPTTPNEAIGKTKISCDSDPRKESLKFRGIYNSNQISGDQSSGKTLTTVNIIPGSFHP